MTILRAERGDLPPNLTYDQLQMREEAFKSLAQHRSILDQLQQSL